jgi:adenylylsulfate kinase
MGNTIWLTGLSGSGKTTLAKYLEHFIMTEAIIIDGDDLRKGVNADLGFSMEDRNKNVERAAHVCTLFNKNNLNVIACIMSPLEEQRVKAKEIIGKDSFFLVYVSCDLDTLRKRDPKGLYAKYDAGEITNMVGIDLPYQVPTEPNIVVNTAVFELYDCAQMISTSYNKWILNKYTTHGHFNQIQSQRSK